LTFSVFFFSVLLLKEYFFIFYPVFQENSKRVFTIGLQYIFLTIINQLKFESLF
jgi:hypothetical protein